MERIATNSSTREIIEKYGFPIRKALGQNFLVNPHVMEKIMRAADLSANDFVIEIGPGLGGLTQALCEAAGHVAAIELDAKLIPILRDTLAAYDNLEIIHEDALKTDFHALIAERPQTRAKLVANLPYYITTPLVMGLLERKTPLHSIIVMVQKEVAARMAAKPGSKDYGALSLAVEYYAEPSLVANVPRNCFMPRPGVDSAVIRLAVRREPAVAVEDEALLFTLIKSAFATRRKTLQNCLSACESLNISKEQVRAALSRCRIDERARGEALTLTDFAALTCAVKEAGCSARREEEKEE